MGRMHPMRGIVAAAMLMALVFGAQAAERVPVESFVADRTFENPRISSNGSYLAVSVDLGDDDHGIMIYRMADMSNTAFIKLPKYQLAAEIHWVNDTRLVYVKGGRPDGREQVFSYGEIIGLDYDGKHHDYIYGYKESTLGAGVHKGFGVFVGLPRERNGTFYMSRGSAENSLPSTMVYEVDASSRSGKSRLVGSIDERDMRFVLDANGVPRFATGMDKHDNHLLYAADGSGKNWRKISTESLGGVFIPFAITPDSSHVYGYFSVENGPSSVVKADMSLANRETLVNDGFNSIDNVLLDANRQPQVIEFKGALPRVAYVDPASVDAKLHAELRKGFPGQHVRFVDQSADGNVSLLAIYSDRNPGEWAVMDRKKDTLARLLQSNASIDPAKMGTRHYVRFQASDGLELDGYVTVPPGAEPAKLPMVLLPHGGPHGVSDTWDFDYDAQFLATRGYLVLQVNYRGSGDRGYAFRELGYRKWGTRIQEDLIDGMKWAVDKGYADPQRICVYGASFGGYSAMMLAAKAPELVKCAAGQSGLYDLRAMANKSDTSRSFYGRAYIERVLGKDSDELRANSPLSLASSIKQPVLLAHGGKDERTPIAQAEAMRRALEKSGNKPIWMEVPKEGHGFYAQNNRIAFYQQLEAFLDQNIGGSR